ncbi:MAG: hypothetical protein AUJ96_30040 [Armatimonadetes bacterium CG2_30_66_41]|nr:hypothetical protein [Armatimonadota bacterium]OIO93538.1 MAG: hypothetical protein AUJ96_30040 [Armatimonadetes bacterium CG2_30_66_41]NCO92770.1 hypothetical protein [Armatimonadota bacterium]NCP29005.1 hypothetical protein [Armatimonadota bacterium]NCQ30030.1 hypothetical protein [Armatimonadota bacterium]
MAAHAEHAPDVYGRELPIVRDLGVGPTMAAAVGGDRLYTIGRGTLRVFDLADPAQPKPLGELGGLGNTRQITVADGVAYITSREDGEPGYGEGHGLESYSLADPAKPKFVSRIKTPPFYHLGNDMWSVQVAGDYAFLADTHNGIFVVNVADLTKSRFVAHRQLPVVPERSLPGYVGGLALAKDHVYVAGGWTDLHVVAAHSPASPGGSTSTALAATARFPLATSAWLSSVAGMPCSIRARRSRQRSCPCAAFPMSP